MDAIRYSVIGWLVLHALARLAQVSAGGADPVGTLQGSARVHTPASLLATVQQAQLVLAAGVVGPAMYVGRYAQALRTATRRVPVVLFQHGSSGLSVAADGDWQRWLAGLGVVSLAPDSFALPDR